MPRRRNALLAKRCAANRRIGDTPRRRNAVCAAKCNVSETTRRRNAVRIKRRVGETPRQRNAASAKRCVGELSCSPLGVFGSRSSSIRIKSFRRKDFEIFKTEICNNFMKNKHFHVICILLIVFIIKKVLTIYDTLRNLVDLSTKNVFFS